MNLLKIQVKNLLQLLVAALFLFSLSMICARACASIAPQHSWYYNRKNGQNLRKTHRDGFSKYLFFFQEQPFYKSILSSNRYIFFQKGLCFFLYIFINIVASPDNPSDPTMVGPPSSLNHVLPTPPPPLFWKPICRPCKIKAKKERER